MIEDLWWALGLLGGVVVTAALVNAVAPVQRPRVRRLVTIYAFYAITLAAAYTMESFETGPWGERLRIVASLLYSFGAVSCAAILIFHLLLPKLRIPPPTILADLMVALAYIFIALWVLSNHGLDATGVVTGGAVASGILALSMQQTLGNILGGVALQLDGSIHEGDWIQLENGKQGKVRAIRWRHTLVETRDWSTIVVPNAQLLANNITILGWRDGQKTPQRMWVYFNIDFRFAPARVIQVCNEAMWSSPVENVAADPKPNCVCMDFARDTRDSFGYYAVRYWILDLAPDDPTNSRVRARIYAALQRAGIPLAIPAVANLVEIHDKARADAHEERSHKRHLDAVRSVKLLQAFTSDELQTLADGLSKVTYSINEPITRQGAVAHWLYILTKGEAEVRARIDRDGEGPAPEVSKLVATLCAPDFFGEMGLMTGEPRANDVVAKTEVECFRLGKDVFERVLLTRPAIADELSEKMAERRIELIAARDNLDLESMGARKDSERERILKGIKTFFGLAG
jgi:small-conductance mechanosensitive channel/CRP-like cAMP-binding protein|nr:mechanosensitive ion channel family protein [Kofleriaceae bacterium]